MKKFNKLTVISILCLLALCVAIFFTVKGRLANREASDAQTVTVTDQAGRSVTIKKPVKRIISGYYVSTSAIMALGIEDRLVAIESNAQSGKRAIYGLVAKQISALPRVGTSKVLDVEKCIALKPDLVILPQRLASTVTKFEELGIPVLLVRPESFDECQEMIDLIAKATDTLPQAEKFRAFARRQRKFLSRLPKNGKDVYITGVPSVLVTFGKNMLQSDLVKFGGGRNVAEGVKDMLWVNVSYEQLLSWDPAVIIIAADARFSEQDVLTDPRLANCRAVKSRQVYKMPNYIEAWDTPVPSGILGSLWLANKLYPTHVTKEYFDKTVKEYYKEFYGFEYDFKKNCIK